MKKTLALCLALLFLAGALFSCGTKSVDEPDTDTAETVGEAVATDYKGPEFFVATDGDNANDGSSEHPFASINAAADRIRALRADGNTDAFTVTVREGVYKTSPYSFQAADGGTSLDAPVIYRAQGNVTILGGREIPFSAFEPVADDGMKARFYPEVADQILVCDLGALGVTAEEIGGVYAYGTANQSSHFDPSYQGTNISFFWNEERMTLARFPNDSGEYLPTDFLWINDETDVLDPGSRGDDNWAGGTLKLSDEANEHLSRWATLDGAWTFGYFKFDWADETTPVKAYDPEAGSVSFVFNPYSEYYPGGSYYFYNVAEELDAPGEYWVDRDNLKLYILPKDDQTDATITFNCVKSPLFSGEIANTTFDGFTFTGYCGDIFRFTAANGFTMQNCTVKFSDSYGFYVSSGNNNTVRRNTFTHMGKGGGSFNGGGDSATLTPSNNLIENNKLLHYSEIQRMYTGGFGLNGVGGTIRHNEIGYAPHSALSAGGQNNTIEWNYVHDVVQECNDGGAYYGGGQWHSIGNVIQYNKFENIGNETHNGTSIYFDDGLSGWTARYNVIHNSAGAGFLVGGGRNIEVYNNLVVGGELGQTCIAYDQRMITWYNMEDHPNVWDPEQNGWWAQLKALPYTEGIWAESFPNLAKAHFDTTRPDDVDFLCNPSYSVVKNNIWIGQTQRWTFVFDEGVQKYAEIGYNYTHTDIDRVFEPGTYELTKVALRDKNLEWEPIPYTGFGVEP